MKQEETDEKYMRRCLQLARNGQQLAKPNPMVGAVIVSKEGRIIGEGYHVAKPRPLSLQMQKRSPLRVLCHSVRGNPHR